MEKQFMDDLKDWLEIKKGQLLYSDSKHAAAINDFIDEVLERIEDKDDIINTCEECGVQVKQIGLCDKHDKQQQDFINKYGR